jgi:GAF domain-containing protein
MLTRNTVRPFTEQQIDLVATFADQAVIAIENMRQFEEVQVRTRELEEALERQTATSEVLQMISSSPEELEPVFQTMLAKATRLCEASFGILFRYDENVFRAIALQAVAPAFAEFLQRNPARPDPRIAVGTSANEATRAHRRYHRSAGLCREGAIARRTRRNCWSSHVSCRADVQRS